MKVSWTFFSYRADRTISQNLLFSISKGHNSKNMQSRVTVLALCMSSHVALHLCKVSWKYLKRFLSYRADTILWQTDGRTDYQGKNNMSPNPTGGDIVSRRNLVLFNIKQQMIHNTCTKLQNSTCNSSWEIFVTNFPITLEWEMEKGKINLRSFVSCPTIYLATLNVYKKF